MRGKFVGSVLGRTGLAQEWQLGGSPQEFWPGAGLGSGDTAAVVGQGLLPDLRTPLPLSQCGAPGEAGDICICSQESLLFLLLPGFRLEHREKHLPGIQHRGK